MQRGRGRGRGGGPRPRPGGAPPPPAVREHDDPSIIRGIYAPEEELDPVLRAGAPKFDTKEQSDQFTQANTRCTNPRYLACKQLYTTLVDWEQVCTYMLPKAEEYRLRFGIRPPVPPPPSNKYLSVAEMTESVRFRLDMPIHRHLCEESSLNTLRSSSAPTPSPARAAVPRAAVWLPV